MDGVEEAEDRIETLEGEVDYLRQIMADYAEHRLFDLALETLRTFQKQPLKDFAGDTYRWPYAGEKSDASFAREVFLVFKSDCFHEAPYRREFAWAADRTCENLGAAEAELLAIGCYPKDREVVIVGELENLVRDAIVSEMVMIARDHDEDVFLD